MQSLIRKESDMKIIKGKTTEEQMKSVDVILNRFSRRLHKTVTGVLSPYPISNYTQSPVNGVVLKYMFPINGRILLGCVFIEDMPKSGVDIYAVVHTEEGHKGETFFAKKQSILIRPNIDVVAGSRLVLSVMPKAEEQVSGIWVSFLWVPEIGDSVIKQFLIDDLEKVREDALHKEG